MAALQTGIGAGSAASMSCGWPWSLDMVAVAYGTLGLWLAKRSESGRLGDWARSMWEGVCG
jgi:hypothetical protein